MLWMTLCTALTHPLPLYGTSARRQQNRYQLIFFCLFWLLYSNMQESDMHGPNGQNVTIWWVTRCFVDIWQKKLRKCQNRQFFERKCTNLVTLVETEFQWYQIAGLPDVNIFGQILAIFGFFSKNLGNNVPFLSGNSPNYDILANWPKHVWSQYTVFIQQILGNCM